MAPTNPPPAAIWRTWPLLCLIGFYRYVISPILHLVAPGAGCRYAPSCSAYAMAAVRRFGPLRGSWLALRRVMDCHPWGGHGDDAVPESWPGWRFSRKSLCGAACSSPEEPRRSSLHRNP